MYPDIKLSIRREGGMIVITLGPEQCTRPGEDDLGRDRIGYSETMSPIALV